MLEGLEISIIKKSELERTNRVDSEFYTRANLSAIDTIKKLQPEPLTNYFSVSDGNHMSISENFSEEGIPYYRGGDIYNFFIEHTLHPLRIPKEVFDLPTMKRSHLQKGDLLVSIVGAIIGNLSIVKTEQLATCSCKLAILRPKNIQSEFAAIFFKSKYGQNQLQKFRRGTGQTGLILEDFDQLLFPIFSSEFRNTISAFVNSSFDAIDKSKQTYKNTEEIILKELGLVNWQPIEANTTVKKFSNSFEISGRLDAEYYQPKFDEVLQVIRNVKHNTLGSIATFKKSIEPGSDAYQTEGIPFIRVSDITKFGLSQPEIHLDINEFDLADLKPKKDTILLSKDGSVGIAYKVEQDLNVITSSALLHLTITDKEILPDYLTLVLNSKLTQMQAERDAGGSIIQHWRPDEIKQVLIPVLPMDTQIELTKQIKQSFKLRLESTKLIDIAKQAVEIAIEQDENEAMKFIKENI